MLCMSTPPNNCMYVYLSSSTKSPVDSNLSVYVIEAILEVLTRGAPPRCMCICAREFKSGYGCVCVCLSFSLAIDGYLCVCVWMYMYVKLAERLQLHKAVILLLFMKNFILSIVSYYHSTIPCKLINK